jgi:hypothetical protein
MRRVVLVGVLVACGDPHTTPDTSNPGVDAALQGGECWPSDVRVAGGSAVLGTGRDEYEPMPEILPMEWGAQDGYMLIAQVRMEGFATGNPTSLLDPTNPYTRIRAYFADTLVPLAFRAGPCAFRTPYVASAAGGFELAAGVPVIFDTCWRSDHLIGARIRVELELMEASGRYTRDVKTVIGGPHPAGHPPDEGTPGCLNPIPPEFPEPPSRGL